MRILRVFWKGRTYINESIVFQKRNQLNELPIKEYVQNCPKPLYEVQKKDSSRILAMIHCGMDATFYDLPDFSNLWNFRTGDDDKKIRKGSDALKKR